MKVKLFLFFASALLALSACEKEEITFPEPDHVHVQYDIGPWNMDADINTSVAHDLNVDLIQSVSILITSDTGYVVGLMTFGYGGYSLDSDSIYVARWFGSGFDSDYYDDPFMNRGVIDIVYGSD